MLHEVLNDILAMNKENRLPGSALFFQNAGQGANYRALADETKLGAPLPKF